MYRGEIFAYPLYLQQKVTNSTFFCMDVTCKYWPYLKKVSKHCPELQALLSMKPFLSVFHAKAHDFKCEVKWSGAYQEGAGLTLGEEVEQVNAFLSRIAVTTKHMSKAGRSDMLTLMAIRWNDHKFENLAGSLSRRYLKTIKMLDEKEKMLESTKNELLLTEVQLKDWVADVKEWAESTTPTDEDALESKIEGLVASIKRRTQHLYKDTDGCKARARVRRKLREEKRMLCTLIEEYNTLSSSAEALCIDTILREDVAWPWQDNQNDHVTIRTKRQVFDQVMGVRRLQEEKKILVAEMAKHWNYLLARFGWLKEHSDRVSKLPLQNTQDVLTDEALNGMQALLKKKLWNIRQKIQDVRHCYLSIFTGAECDFLQMTSDFPDSDLDSDLDDMY
ncbi:uncharacterized protein LOC129409464 isoform X2 [Boleophthalmus pectinirostris]|uniref:uncharacterized protein LOC129409464 isoform X2 n=1 Tax=Boleophthalmus pectinirostris TaxID=150288 RepID=UPI002430B390|nr:uncharacterized protein LOC129409464 isoform X2 [Boleophthalmus pectinirostris]